MNSLQPSAGSTRPDGKDAEEITVLSNHYFVILTTPFQHIAAEENGLYVVVVGNSDRSGNVNVHKRKC